MIEDKSITVEISTTGEMKVEAHGFKGEGCMEATKKLMESMASNTTATDYKPEFYQTEKVKNTQSIG